MPILFGVQIYEGYLDLCDENKIMIAYITQCFKENSQKGLNEKEQWNFACGIWNTFFHTRNILEIETFSMLRISIEDQIKQYIQSMSECCQKVSLSMHDSWVNVQRPGQFQEYHDHLSSKKVQFSGVYYLSVPQRSGNIQFRHPNVKLLNRWSDDLACLRHNFFYVLQPKNGLLLLFPSWLDHMVQKNESDFNRISLSFNFSIELN